MTVLYEVQLAVDAGIADAVRACCRGTSPNCGGCRASSPQRSCSSRNPRPRRGLCVCYRLRDRAALDGYLRDYAGRLRADGQARFGGRFRAGRRVLAPVA